MYEGGERSRRHVIHNLWKTSRGLWKMWLKCYQTHTFPALIGARSYTPWPRYRTVWIEQYTGGRASLPRVNSTLPKVIPCSSSSSTVNSTAHTSPSRRPTRLRSIFRSISTTKVTQMCVATPRYPFSRSPRWWSLQLRWSSDQAWCRGIESPTQSLPNTQRWALHYQELPNGYSSEACT